MKRTILKDTLLTIAVLAVCSLISVPLSKTSADNNPFAVPIYILAVALVSRFTNGYVYGMAASLAAVVCVNFLFTYPFRQFDFTLTGYPLTFGVMILVSIIISAQTTRVKTQERLRYEIIGEQMRANLLRAISHDLRTPLTSIMGASSVLIENSNMSDADRKELLSGINADASWLMRVTENLLSVTKLSQENVTLKKTEEVVEEIIGSAIVKFRKLHSEMNVIVKKPEEILLAPMDATLIEQVVYNLLENAAIHAKGAKNITVSTGREGDKALFSFVDDGEGFPKAVVQSPLTLQTFHESKGGDARRSMGIGLTVCNSIIRAHGGEMRVYNANSGGAAVDFYLPCGEE